MAGVLWWVSLLPEFGFIAVWMITAFFQKSHGCFMLYTYYKLEEMTFLWLIITELNCFA